MSEGRSKTLWAHTSSIWALFMDLYRKPGDPARFKLADFNPHLASQPQKKRKDFEGVKMSEVRELMKTGMMRGKRI